MAVLRTEPLFQATPRGSSVGKKAESSQVWRCIPVTPTPGRPKQENIKFRESLGYGCSLNLKSLKVSNVCDTLVHLFIYYSFLTLCFLSGGAVLPGAVGTLQWEA